VDLSLTKEAGLGEINHLAAALVTLVTGIGDSDLAKLNVRDRGKRGRSASSPFDPKATLASPFDSVLILGHIAPILFALP
jgi:hypothetical protein